MEKSWISFLKNRQPIKYLKSIISRNMQRESEPTFEKKTTRAQDERRWHFVCLLIYKKVNNETTRRVQELDGVYLQSLSRIRRLSFVWQGVTISYLSTLLLFVFKTFFWYKRVVCFTQKSYSWTDNKTKQIYFYEKPCQGERDFAN